MTTLAAPFDLVGQQSVIATMHGKEAIIRPLLSRLGLRFSRCPAIDTDRFGTFTREIARPASQRETLLAKARAGLDRVPQARYAVASEGAFGPDPVVPILPADCEMVALLDRETGRAIVGRYATTSTNYRQADAVSWDDALRFARQIGFPSHGVVVMDPEGGLVTKDAMNIAALEQVCRSHIAAFGSVWLESDMRAHRNPTRRIAIAAATADLARRLRARCPQCAYPDWTPAIRDGRPCAWCDGPTLDAWTEQFRCEACGHALDRCIEPTRKAQPDYCGHCNP